MYGTLNRNLLEIFKLVLLIETMHLAVRTFQNSGTSTIDQISALNGLVQSSLLLFTQLIRSFKDNDISTQK